jgi:hypothetical protein
MSSELNTPQAQVALAARSNIIHDYYERVYGNAARVPSPGLLYHYTTADGLKGIIEGNELWATSAYFLNDSAEISYGYDVLAEVLKDWIANNPRPEDSLPIGLARDMEHTFGKDYREFIIKPIYLACFCEEDNLLSQWRTYGQSGGYSIGFQAHVEGPCGGLRPEPPVYTAKWVKVSYDRNEHIARCRQLLDLFLPLFDDHTLADALTTVDLPEHLGYSGFLRLLSEILVEETMGFKNRAFDVEKEWRIVVRERELLKQETDDGGRTEPLIHSRSLRGVLTPYVKLVTPTGKPLPIASIRSGPTLDKRTAAMAIATLLDQNKYRRVFVHGSDISVRF